MNRICFVGVDNHFLLNPVRYAMPVNGEVVQQVLLARAFRELGFEVSTVVYARDAEIDETVDDIRILSAFSWNAGIPILRFFHPRATGVFRALNEINADVYFQSPAGALTGFTAAYCRWKRRKFIFRIASDVDCIPGQQLIKHWRDRKLFEYGLRRANVLAAQSTNQAELLRIHYGLAASVVDMAMEQPEESLDGERDIDVIWISNIKHVKRPDRLLAVARLLPDVKFTMIGGVVGDERLLYSQIEKEVESLPNVEFLGQVSYERVNQFIARAKLLANTSDVEGFPNTFLQAWARKVPVVSMFDPDGIIETKAFGHRSEGPADMVLGIQMLLSEDFKRLEIGARAQQYVLSRFSANSAAKKYLELCGA